MSATETPISDRALHALVDGRLAPDEATALETRLAADAEASARAAAWRAQNAALKAMFDPILAEPVPARLSPSSVLARRVPVKRWAWRAAAAVAIFAAGGLAGWFGRDMLPTGRLGASMPAVARDAATAHSVFVAEVRHPVEVTTAEYAHLVGWLSKRLGTKLKVPALENTGFALMGGRLLPSAGGRAAAQFMYENGQGQRLTLYLRAGEDARTTAFRFVREGRVNGFYWMDGTLSYALMGEIERDQLLPLARRAYAELNP